MINLLISIWNMIPMNWVILLILFIALIITITVNFTVYNRDMKADKEFWDSVEGRGIYSLIISKYAVKEKSE